MERNMVDVSQQQSDFYEGILARNFHHYFQQLGPNSPFACETAERCYKGVQMDLERMVMLRDGRMKLETYKPAPTESRICTCGIEVDKARSLCTEKDCPHK